MILANYSREMIPEIEAGMMRAVSHHKIIGSGLEEMLTYHLGWTGTGAGVSARGKRIRPLLLLLCAGSAGGEWRDFVPAAASVELIHNFSLIHDDIEDDSQERRGRKTVWAIWGRSHAINAGDLMLSLAFSSLGPLKQKLSTDKVTAIHNILEETCIALTSGQYLDMEFETRETVTVDEYWKMIEGKTGSLLSACAQIGAICGGACDELAQLYKLFGMKLGLAFQVWDDWLGIWGNEENLGKSTLSDLTSRKKTYPVLLGLNRNSMFAKRWYQGSMLVSDIENLKILLQDEGVELETLQEARKLTHEAMSCLSDLDSGRPEFEALVELSKSLIERNN